MLSRLPQAAFYGTAELAVRQGGPLLISILLARVLTPADFGAVAMILVFISIGSVIADAGMSTALVQMRSSTKQEESSAFLISIATGLLLALAMSAAFPLTAAFVGRDDLDVIGVVAALSLPFTAATVVPAALLTRALDFRSQAWASLLATVAGGGIALAMAFTGFGVWSLVVSLPTTAAVRAIALWATTGWYPGAWPSIAAARRLLGFGSWLIGAALLDALYQRGQALIVGKLYGVVPLGHYHQAQALQNTANSILGVALARVGLPLMAATKDDREQFRAAFRTAAAATMLANMPLMVAMSINADDVIDILLGSQWDAAARLLSILALAGVLWPLQVLNVTALNAHGRPDLFFRAEMVKKPIGLAAVLLASPFGIEALAWGVVVASGIALVVNAWWSRAIMDVGLGVQLRASLPSFVIGSGMAATMAIVRLLIPEGSGRLACSLAVGFVAYAGMTVLLLRLGMLSPAPVRAIKNLFRGL